MVERILVFVDGFYKERVGFYSAGASGIDLVANIEDVLVMHPHKVYVVGTGVRVVLPYGYEAQVRSRSGLATKGIFVLNAPGTVDSDYTGEIKVILCNITDTPFTIHPGDRIAQLVFTKIHRDVSILDYQSNLNLFQSLTSHLERQDKGLGSTGM